MLCSECGSAASRHARQLVSPGRRSADLRTLGEGWRSTAQPSWSVLDRIEQNLNFHEMVVIICNVSTTDVIISVALLMCTLFNYML